LFAFLLNFTRDEADTRDLLQEIFVKLARRPDLLNSVKDERAFLIGLAHHAAIDFIRRRGTRQKYHEQFAGEPVVLFASTGDPDAAAFRRALLFGVVHQNLPHRLGGDSEEVCAALPLLATPARQAQIRFVHHGCSLQCLRRPTPFHGAPGEAVQLAVNHGEHFISGCLVPAGPLVQKFRHSTNRRLH